MSRLQKTAVSQGLLAQEGLQRLSGIPDDVLNEALQDPWLMSASPDIQDPVSDAIPIHHEGKVVGFHLPAKNKRTGEQTVGDVFVSPEYRGKGLGTKTLKSYLEANPDVTSFVHNDNAASRAAHLRAGFVDTLKSPHKGATPASYIWRRKGYDAALKKLGLAPI